MAFEYSIYCDESDAAGTYFSNFYGGILVRSTDLFEVEEKLSDAASRLGLGAEIKWQKISKHYQDQYIAFIREVFSLVAQDKVKIRIMFTQNIHEATGLDPYHYENKYFLLYYQFIKHAFGLRYSRLERYCDAYLKILFDQLPDTKEKSEAFKDHIFNLRKYREFEKAGIKLRREQIVEIDSKRHILAQALDVVLGSIQFRLNDKHLDKPVGASRRGKRTIAKERVYKEINQEIREIYPNFNIGVSTGTQGQVENRWFHPYRHWRFVPRGARIDTTRNPTKK